MLPSNPGDHYVALGSSFAAGPGIGKRATGSPRKSGRSASNYAHLVAAQLDLELSDVTYSGSTVAEMLLDQHSPTNQLGALTTDTALVTVTAGGNDVGYLPGLFAASLPGPVRLIPKIRRQIADITGAGEDAMDRFDRLEVSMKVLVREIRRRSPQTQIVLVDYLTILPADETISTAPLPSVVAAAGRSIAARLAETYQSVATSEECLYAPVSALSTSHHAWAAQPWTRKMHYSLRRGAPYHPNSDGMTAVAQLIVRTLEGSAQ